MATRAEREQQCSWERWNTHFSTMVEQEIMGTVLRLAQDPNTEHLGTTVWDASIVLAKYLEKNMRKGELSRSKLSGKKAIELGSGMGLGGMAFAMLGADVVLTDVPEVLPLLRRNYEANLSPAACRARNEGVAPSAVGRVSVQELDWMKPGAAAALAPPPPYEYVLAADCVYSETILPHLHSIIMQVTNERSTVLIVNELRSQTVHALFHEIFLTTFTIKTVPHAKMDPVYQHPAIEIFVLKRRKAGRGGGGSGAAAPAAAAPADGSVPPGNADDDDTEATAEATASSLAAAVVEAGSCRGEGASAGAATVSGASTLPAAVADDEEALTRQMAGLATNDGSKNSGGADSGAEGTHGPPQQPQLRDDPSSSLSSDWQTRRAGAMAARLLADVKVPQQSQGPR